MSSSSVELDAEAVRGALGEATTVLLLSSDDRAEEVICSALVSAADPADLSLLGIAVEGTPDERLDVWRRNIGSLPRETGFITVGETTRSAAAVSPTGPSPSPVSIESVEAPSDLTGLAIAISTYLEDWSDSATTPVVCFFSLTSLLSHSDRSRIFRFIHATNDRLQGIGAMAHYHLDPTVYDEGTVNAFSSLFDAVIRVDDDGSVSVSKRR